MKICWKPFGAILLLLLLAGCGRNSESRNNKSIKETKETELMVSMIDVRNMSLPEAEEKLNLLGFRNVEIKKNDPEWPDNRYVVTEQSVESGTEVKVGERITLQCSKRCDVYLDLTSASNLFLDTYDLDIYLNDDLLGSVPNGKTFTKLVSILEGNYEVIAYKSGNNDVKATKKIKVEEDITFKSNITHGRSISFKDTSTTSGIVGAELTMIDVTGLVLQEAASELNDIGFINVREEPFGSIWDKNNWIVVNQGLSPGVVADKNEYIQLDCIKLNDYFKDNYVGKNLAEVQEMADEFGFEMRYESTEGRADIGSIISGLSEENKIYWTVDRARQYGAANKTVVVSVTYQGTPEEREAWEQARKESEAAEMARKQSEAARKESEAAAAQARRESEAAAAQARRESEAAAAQARKESEAAAAQARRESEAAAQVRKESEAAREQAKRESIEAEKSTEESLKAKETEKTAESDYISIKEYAKTVKATLSRYDYVKVETKDNLITVMISQSGITNTAYNAAQNRKKKKEWDHNVADSIDYLCKQAFETGKELCGPETTVGFMIVSDYDYDTVLYSTLNGIKLFDITD